MNHNLHKVSFIFAISIVCFVLPINTDAKIKHLDYHLEYVSKVALETGNIWKRNLIDPLSKIWQPWFNPGSTEIYTRGATNKKITEITEEAGTEKNVGEVLSVSVAQGTSAPSQVTTQEVLAWLKDLFLLQQTQNYSNSPVTQAASPVIHQYYTSGVTQGLADSVGRSIKEINTSIGGGLESLQANGVFNTSVLSVDTVNTRVGIGTSSPTDTLSVNGAVYLAQVSAPSNTSNRLYNVGGDLYWAGNLIGGASSGNWATDGTSVWRASGNVGVGTTTPFAKLSVESTAGAAQFVVGSSTATQFIVDKNGNVGVGIKSPRTNFDMLGSNSILTIDHSTLNAGTVGIQLSHTNGETTQQKVGILSDAVGSWGRGNLYFAVNTAADLTNVSISDTKLMISGNSGNVGIGTDVTAAASKLGVAGGVSIGASYSVLNAAPTNGLLVQGNVGVGTSTPFARLSVESTAGTAQFVVGSSSATQFIVDKNGKVGIGTANPTIGGLEINNTGGTFSSIPANTVGLGIINQTGWSGVGFTVSNSANNAFSMVHVGSTSYFARITGSATNHWMRLTDTGLRYGTSGDTAVNRLDIEGSAAFGSYAGTAAPANGLIVSGNVGVGTTTPWGLLSVNANGLTGGAPQFVVGSSTATNFIVANNGNVGVGTAAPGFLLHVNGNAMVGATVPTYIPSAPLNLVNSAGGNMKTQLSLVNTGGGDGAGSAIDFFTYDLAGGTNPGLKIAAYDNNYSADFAILTKNPGSAANAITERFRITNTGNVGIGTTTPNTLLNILSAADSGPGTVGKGAFQISYTNTNGLSFGSYNSIPFANWIQSMDHRIGNNNTYPLVLNPIGGNVGIGTTSPSGMFSIENTGSEYTTYITDATNDPTPFTIGNDGRVGIGTAIGGLSTAYKLVVNNGSNLNFGIGVQGGELSIESANDTFGAAIPMRLYASEFNLLTGNVGIGTTTPWRTLSVNGTVAVPSLVNDSTGYYACVNTTTGQLSTSTTACGASSERFKENIQDIGYGLEQVLGLRPVSFDYKESYIPNGPKQLGFIAEEVDLVVPELVARDAAGQIQGLDYPKFTAVLAKAIQELNEKMDAVITQMQVALAWFTSDGKFKVQNDICVDDVCVTKDQFKQILLDSAVGATQTIDNSPQIVNDSREEEIEDMCTASSTPEIQTDTETNEGNASTTPEIIPDTPEENASTTPETMIETPSETASTTPSTE